MVEPRKLKGRVVKNFAKKRFTNAREKDLHLPEHICVVCVRLLYVEERCWMKAAVLDDVEKGIGGEKMWPILSYRKKDGTPFRRLNRDAEGRVPVCKTHSSANVKGMVEYINFVNKNWCYPGDQPEQLKWLHPSAEGFLSPIIVFCELTNSRSRLTRATRAGHHFVSGRIGLYESKDYLGAYVGTRGLTKLGSSDSRLSQAEIERIVDAWRYLVEYHPLFRGLDVAELGGNVEKSEEMRLEEYDHEGRVNVNKSKFGAFHMVPVDGGGPKSGDERYRMEDMAIGILGNDQRLVKYSNPCLLGYLFPTLYPRGRGYFSMKYEDIPVQPMVDFIEEGLDDGFGAVDDVRDNDWSSSDGSGSEENSDDEDSSGKIKKGKGSGLDYMYSRTTLKSYAKFRLMGVDRRFGRNIKYILMLFDWIQKVVVFGHQMRGARKTMDGRDTRAGDVIEKKEKGKGTKYRESSTVSIPPSIRTGAKYKSKLYLKFSTLFEKYGTPQLFGTFTCDAESEGQRNIARWSGEEGSSTHDDPVLFTMHWKRQWKAFFKFMRGDWAESRVGGLKAWCWVFEMQDRGTPHTHFCLWTIDSVDKMISNDIITCSRNLKDDRERELVLKHQVHRAPCGAYCKPGGRETCRFGFPKPVNLNLTFYDDKTGRFVLHRNEGDERIVGYNMELLKFGMVNMDLQYNVGAQAKKYMCKYVTKQAGTKKATIYHEDGDSIRNLEPSKAYVQNFHFRSVGVVEAIMDVCSWAMHGSSQDCIFLTTDLPRDRNKVLKRANELGRMKKEETDIWFDDKFEKYLKRPRNTEGGPDFESMPYMHFFTYFNYGERKNTPIYLDMGNRKVFRRPHEKEVLVRTKPISATKSEDAFMHLLMLYCSTRDEVTDWIGPSRAYQSYQELALVKLGREFISQVAPGLLVVIDHGPVLLAIEKENLLEQVKEELIWTKDQEMVIGKVRENMRNCRLIVTGAGGTGKSAILEKLCRDVSTEGYNPVRLAPSGVAAQNIRGETIHRWFKISKMGGGNGFPLCNSHSIREKLLDMKEEGKKPFFFVDEVSMVSGTLLTAMSAALQDASFESKGDVFGGYPVVLFGDYGQLCPINKTGTMVDWVWKSEIYRMFERMDLIEGCRQRSDQSFKNMLDCVRSGKLTGEACEVLMEIIDASQKVSIPPNALHLMPHKYSVEKLNDWKLKALPGQLWWNVAQDDTGYVMDDSKKHGIEVETGLLSVLKLKIGARVMCTSNVDVSNGLVNGTLGVVEALYGAEVVEIRADNGRLFRITQDYRITSSDMHERRQFPLVLAWALTIHKSQSLTLESAVVHLSRSFTSGQAYVAMSRVRSREHLFIMGVSLEALTGVSHAVKSRLTKSRELGRTEEDDRIEKKEEGLGDVNLNDSNEKVLGENESGWEEQHYMDVYHEDDTDMYQGHHADVYQSELTNIYEGGEEADMYQEEYNEEAGIFHTNTEEEYEGAVSTDGLMFGRHGKRPRDFTEDEIERTQEINRDVDEFEGTKKRRIN